MLFDPAATRALNMPSKNGQSIAVEITEGQGPTFLWLCGYGGEMTGVKASYFKHQCEAWSFHLVRFDYRGCGQSPGDIKAMTISDYLDDAEAILKQATDGPVILIGSSLGGWLSMRLMDKYPSRIAGFIGISAAPDFTKGITAMPPTDDRYAITQALVDDGNANHLVLEKPLIFTGFAALLQGQRDTSVHWQTALKIAETLTTDSVHVHLVKDGDHSLSREQDLELLWQVANSVREKIIGPVQPMPDENDDIDITV